MSVPADRIAPPPGERQHGRVASWQADKGFGFVTPDSGPGDLFIHVSTLRACGLEGELRSGEAVEFAAKLDRRRGRPAITWIRRLTGPDAPPRRGPVRMGS